MRQQMECIVWLIYQHVDTNHARRLFDISEFVKLSRILCSSSPFVLVLHYRHILHYPPIQQLLAQKYKYAAHAF